MSRLSYEIVQDKVWEMTSSVGMQNSYEEAADVLEKVDEYLVLCGWDPKDFWEETFIRVNENWDIKSCLN
jgi:hypothetical protein